MIFVYTQRRKKTCTSFIFLRFLLQNIIIILGLESPPGRMFGLGGNDGQAPTVVTHICTQRGINFTVFAVSLSLQGIISCDGVPTIIYDYDYDYYLYYHYRYNDVTIFYVVGMAYDDETSSKSTGYWSVRRARESGASERDVRRYSDATGLHTGM